MGHTVALLVLLAAPHSRHVTYVMAVGGVPVGAISFVEQGSTYTYRALHLYRGGRTDVFTRTFDLRKVKPEVWWLTAPRPEGCAVVTEERTGNAETVCTNADGTAGTIDRVPFTASYARDPTGHDMLVRLDLAGARFEAAASAAVEATDPFGGGFDGLGGDRGPAALEPAGPAEAPRHVRGVLSRAASPSASCLTLARAYVATHPGAAMVSGVVVDNGRAWPHAWVKSAEGEHLDPTVGADEPNERPYLAFDAATSGRLYLELLGGTRRVVRRSRD